MYTERMNAFSKVSTSVGKTRVKPTYMEATEQKERWLVLSLALMVPATILFMVLLGAILSATTTIMEPNPVTLTPMAAVIVSLSFAVTAFLGGYTARVCGQWEKVIDGMHAEEAESIRLATIEVQERIDRANKFLESRPPYRGYVYRNSERSHSVR